MQASLSDRNARRYLLPAMILAGALAAATTARADTRWQEAGSGAVAILPVPSNAKGVVGGSLSCAEQRWGFILRSEPGSVAAGTVAPVKLVIGDAIFEAEGREVSGTIQFAVDSAVLDPLRRGARLGFSMGEKGSIAKAVFSLSGSRAVIGAIEPRCTPIDMTAYRPVTLSDTDPGAAEAAELMAGEAKLFTAFAGKKPTFSAATLHLDGGRRLLFVSLCGSTAYYGPSGCTLSGFASEATGPWREVYNTEGLALYIDAAATRDGWPGLATLADGGDEKSLWTWDGAGYSLADDTRQAARRDVVAQ